MILNRHIVEPVGIVATGLLDAERYGYGFYRTSASERDEAPSRASSRPARQRLPR
jgi:hypothetical protein